MTYDSWKTRSPDDDLGNEPISPEEERANWEDEMQQRDIESDLRRAIAVIADLCGAGRPAVKESAEELAEWAEEFTDRYFSKPSQRIAADGYPITIDQYGDPSVSSQQGNCK